MPITVFTLQDSWIRSTVSKDGDQISSMTNLAKTWKLINLALINSFDTFTVPINLKLIAFVAIKSSRNYSSVFKFNNIRSVYCDRLSSLGERTDRCWKTNIVHQNVGMPALITSLTIIRASSTLLNILSARTASTVVQEISGRAGLASDICETYRASW